VCEIDADWEIQRTVFRRLASSEESERRLARWLAMWEEQGTGFWLFSDADGNLVGHAGLFPSPQTAGATELGYILKPAFWKRGYATEIARALVDLAFGDLGLDELVANTMPENAASRRVLERVGFSFAGETLYKGELPNAAYRMKSTDRPRDRPTAT